MGSRGIMLTSSLAESPIIMHSVGEICHCWQMCSRAAGDGLYGLKSRHSAGRKGWELKWFAWKKSTEA